MSTPPPGCLLVEKVDRNPDGSTTVYGQLHNGEPAVMTFPAGAMVAKVVRSADQ